MWIRNAAVRHVGIALLAHTAAALAAGGVMSIAFLWIEGASEYASLHLLRTLEVLIIKSLVIAILVWSLTVVSLFFIYTLAVFISHRFGQATVILIGCLLGFILGTVFVLSGSGLEDYPALTLAEYRTRTREVIVIIVPASSIAGMIFGWVVATFEGTRRCLHVGDSV